jgi:hypothetical protein
MGDGERKGFGKGTHCLEESLFAIFLGEEMLCHCKQKDEPLLGRAVPPL